MGSGFSRGWRSAMAVETMLLCRPTRSFPRRPPKRRPRRLTRQPRRGCFDEVDPYLGWFPRAWLISRSEPSPPLSCFFCCWYLTLSPLGTGTQTALCHSTCTVWWAAHFASANGNLGGSCKFFFELVSIFWNWKGSIIANIIQPIVTYIWSPALFL